MRAASTLVSTPSEPSTAGQGLRPAQIENLLSAAMNPDTPGAHGMPTRTPR